MRLRTGLVGLVVGGSMTLAGVAMAATDDTLLVEGFDSENHTLVFGVSEIGEDSIDCTVEGPGYTYEVDGVGSVTSLTKNGLSASFKLAGIDLAYGDTDGVCDLTAIDVTGPAGQVNHGQVVSSFVHALKAQLRESGATGGIGCLVRLIGQSSYGKGDQQQGPSDADQAIVTTGEVELTSHQATCSSGGDSDDASEVGSGQRGHGSGNPHGNGNGKGHNR